MYGISSSGKESITIAIERMFDQLAYKLLGNIPKLRDKSPFFGSSSPFSLAHIFIQAMNNREPNHVERDVLRSILNSSYGYIESLKNRTSSNVTEAVDALVKEAKIKNSHVSSAQVVEIISAQMNKARSDMQLIAEAETTKTRNMGHTMDIARKSAEQGIEDPSVFFIIVRDGKTCNECLRLHMLPDGVTPKVYKMGELSMGWHKRGDDRPSACGEHPHCFTGNQRIATDKGLFTFKELFDSQIAPKVLIDYRVKNRKSVGNQFGVPIMGDCWLDLHSIQDSYFKQATSVYDTGIQEVIKFTMDSGQEIEVSIGHEMWVEVGNTNWSKKEARNLIVGDKIPLFTKGESFGEDHFPIEAELMGNLLGDGCINEKTGSAEWKFFGKDIPYGEKLFELIKNKYPHSSFSDSLTINGPNNKYSVDQASFRSNRLGKIFQKEFNLNKKPRSVPERLFKADKETVSAFLKGLYAADGCTESSSVQISQNNLEFLKEIQMLLSMFGFVSRIYNHDEAHQKMIKYADGTEYLTDRKQTWRLFINGAEQFNKFVDTIGFGVPFKQERAISHKVPISEIRSYWRTAKIEKIESIGLQQTYCLTEPMTNTITVNGIVTGQCRCTLSELSPGWGFKGGFVSFISLNHDEYSHQRLE
jgi:hypothetical protein